MKKNCKKGYGCGLSCISMSKICRKQFPEGVAYSLADRMLVRSMPVKEGRIASPVQKITTVNEFSDALDKVKEGYEREEKELFSKKFYAEEREKQAKEDYWRQLDGKDSEFLAFREAVAKAAGVEFLEGDINKSLQLLEDSQKEKFFQELERNYDKYLPPGSPIREKYESAKGNWDRTSEEVVSLQAKMDSAKAKYEKAVEDVYSRGDDITVLLYNKRSALRRWGNRSTTTIKTVKEFMKAGLTQEEAVAMAAWVSIGDYEALNKAIYAPEQLDPIVRRYVQRINEVIPQAVKKLPKGDRDEMMEVWRAREPDLADENKLYRPGVFRKDVFIPRNRVESFLRPYREAQGEVIEEKNHIGATNRKDLDYFRRDANVAFLIKAKDDGTGNGVALDRYKVYDPQAAAEGGGLLKNNVFEGEIFWAGGQKFRVLGVKEKNDKYEVNLEEI